MLGAPNSSQIDEFFIRGQHEALDVYFNNQSYYGLPRQSIQNNTDRIILFKQTLGDVESMYKDVGGYVMKYDDFKEMFLNAWSGKLEYLCFDTVRNIKEGKNHTFNEIKNTYHECIPGGEAF